MKILGVRYLSFLILVLAFLATGRGGDLGRPAQKDEKDGTLVVLVTWGDLDNTPATNVYIEAHGFVPKYRSEKSFVLKSLRDGQYEATLPPAVYDVFVSDGTSEPRCRRVLIRPGLTETWTLKLKIDEVYTQH